MAAQLRVTRRDPLERTLETLCHRHPRPLPVRGGPAPPLRAGELLQKHLDLLAQPLRPTEVVQAFRFHELLAQLRDARPVRVARAGVEEGAGMAEVGAGGKLVIGAGARTLADLVPRCEPHDL